MRDKTGKVLTTSEIIQKGVVRIRTICLELWICVFHFVGLVPLHSIRNLFYALSGIRMGKNSAIHTGLRVYNPSSIILGEGTIVGENCVLDGRDRLQIGSHVDIASEVMIYNSHHDINDEYFRAITKPVKIEDYVFIGPRAIILPGVTLKKGCVVGAGAVVTKDVPEQAVVGGIPANVIGERKLKDFRYQLGRPALFR